MVHPEILAAGGLLSVGVLLYQLTSPKSTWWRRQVTLLLARCRDQGWTVDEERLLAQHHILGQALKLTYTPKAGGKSHSPMLRVTLDLAGAPSGLKLENEDLLTGIYRVLGDHDTEVGDSEFDAAFWVQGQDQESARAYLTPHRRRALLATLPFVPQPRLIDGVLESTSRPLLATSVASTAEQMTTHFSTLAQVFGQPDRELEIPIPNVLRHKVRRAALGSMGLFLCCLLVALVPPESLGRQAALAVSTIGIIAGAGAYLAGELGRALLQSFYAFLSLLTATAAALYFTGALGPLHVADAAAVLMATSVGIAICWGARHHLKRLSRYPQGP